MRTASEKFSVSLDYVRTPDGRADQGPGQNRGISMASVREHFGPAAAANVRQALAVSGLPISAGGRNRAITRARAFALPPPFAGPK